MIDLLAVLLAAFLAAAVTGQVHRRRAEGYAGQKEQIISLQGSAEALASHVEWLQGHLAAAHETIVELKREGFELPAAAASVVDIPEAPKVPTVVMDAIHGIARPGDLLYNQLLAQAETDLAIDGVEAKDVAQKIAKGSSYSPYA